MHAIPEYALNSAQLDSGELVNALAGLSEITVAGRPKIRIARLPTGGDCHLLPELCKGGARIVSHGGLRQRGIRGPRVGRNFLEWRPTHISEL